MRVMYEYSFYIQATSQRMVGLKLSLISGFIESHPSVSVTFEGLNTNCNQPDRGNLHFAFNKCLQTFVLSICKDNFLLLHCLLLTELKIIFFTNCLDFFRLDINIIISN